MQETGQALKIIEEQVIAIQSLGLAEVNTAVNQMDQVTQQNAAMVEESTAASTTLANEVDRLREIISEFNIGSNREEAARKPEAARSHHKAVDPRQDAFSSRVAGAVRLGGGSAAAAESWEEF